MQLIFYKENFTKILKTLCTDPKIVHGTKRLFSVRGESNLTSNISYLFFHFEALDCQEHEDVQFIIANFVTGPDENTDVLVSCNGSFYVNGPLLEDCAEALSAAYVTKTQLLNKISFSQVADLMGIDTSKIITELPKGSEDIFSTFVDPTAAIQKLRHIDKNFTI